MGIPYTNEFDLNVHRKGLLERSALFPACFIIAGVHIVREGNLLVVSRGK
jgi:hypothetical protein